MSIAMNCGSCSTGMGREDEPVQAVTIRKLIGEAREQLAAAGIDQVYGRYPADCYINRLLDRGYSRNGLPLHLSEEGYTPVIKTTSGGRAEATWGRGEKRSRVYARAGLPEDIRVKLAKELVGEEPTADTALSVPSWRAGSKSAPAWATRH